MSNFSDDKQTFKCLVQHDDSQERLLIFNDPIVERW